MIRRGLRCWALVGVLVTPICPLSAQERISPPDVQLLAQTIQDQVELIRWHMGRPPEDRPPIPVQDVTVRENFRQAMALWRKVNQLGVELVGGGEVPPIVAAPRDGEFLPEHVHEVLLGVTDRLGEIHDGIEIVGSAAFADRVSDLERDPSATPTDVFRTIVQANRQVNRMLERAAQPGDVYQLVQQGVFLASEILSAIGDANPYPPLGPLEPGLRPEHSYSRLLEVFTRLSNTFDALGLQMLHWAGGAFVIDDTVTPSDVLDMANLLISELEYLHQRTPGARAPIQAEHPGRRWPSDVYRLAGVLREQCLRIQQQARSNPDHFRNRL